MPFYFGLIKKEPPREEDFVLKKGKILWKDSTQGSVYCIYKVLSSLIRTLLWLAGHWSTQTARLALVWDKPDSCLEAIFPVCLLEPPYDGSLVSPPHCTTPHHDNPHNWPQKWGKLFGGVSVTVPRPLKTLSGPTTPLKRPPHWPDLKEVFFKVVGILLVVALVVPHWIAPPGRRHWVAGAAATTSGGRAMAISACLCECGCVCVADGPGQLMMPITNPARIYFSALGRLGGFPCRIFSSKDLSLYAEFFYRYVFWMNHLYETILVRLDTVLCFYQRQNEFDSLSKALRVK